MLVCEDSKDFSLLFLSFQGTNDHKISNGSDFIIIGVTRKAKTAITRAESSVVYNEIFFDYLCRRLFPFSQTLASILLAKSVRDITSLNSFFSLSHVNCTLYA